MSVSSVPGLSQLLGGFGSTSFFNALSSQSSGTTSSSGTVSSASSSSSSSSSSSLSAIAQYDLQNLQSATTSLNGYSALQSTLGAFQNSMFSVLTLPFASALSGITSSDGNVAYLSTSAANTYAVNVTQLAEPQKVTTTDTFNDETTANFAVGGTLVIQPGDVDTTDGTFTSGGSPVTVTLTDGSLNGVVSAINKANAGVTASITGAAGAFSLKIVSNDSGQSSGFQITGADPAGGAGSTSLADLTYTAATAKAGTAKYTVSQAAQDAAYTVNGQAFGSPTNLGVPVTAGVNINLVATGSTIISQPQSPTNVVNAADGLASTVNALVQTFQQLTGSGGQLAGQTTIISQIQNDIVEAINNTYTGSNTTNNLNQLGFQRQSDGTFTVDTSQLASQYQTDPTGTENLLSAVADAVVQATESYLGANGQVSNQLTQLQSQQTIYEGQLKADEQTTSTAQAKTTAHSAVAAYNLLSEANGGGESAFTSEV